MGYRCCLGLFLILLAILPLAADEVDFDRDVRAILSDKCFQCHGPDESTRQADLRLDTKAGALADREGSVAFAPGDTEKSEALRRIFSDDPDERMPPSDAKLILSAKDKKTLRQWVAEGAKWTEHWSFVPPAKPEPPSSASKWPRNAIDYFVLQKMIQAGLSPSVEASRTSLIRRVTLDLTGLPPTPEEVDAFLHDKTDGAYETVVDRLLRSNRYGERMAWEWLDAARYADTDGFQGDPTRTMWPWREWLIHALNKNMPFDQFTIEMLAGDLLPGASESQIIATGFNRNHMYNGEGGRIAEETRVENVFDRTETTSTVWLGLTMTCCRCHDHKFDPIRQQEYYELFAFFNNTSESGSRGGGRAPPVLNYLPSETKSRLAELDQQLAGLQQQMNQPMPELDKAQVAWEAETAAKLKEQASSAGAITMSPWQVLGPLPLPTGSAEPLFKHEFGPEKKIDLQQKFAAGKIGWREEKSFADGKVHDLPTTVGATYLYRALEAPGPRTVDLSLGSDDGIRLWLNGKELLASNVNRAAAADQESARLELPAGKSQLLIKIVNTGGIGGFYFQKKSESIGGLPPEIAKLLLLQSDKRNEKQRIALRDHFRSTHSASWKKLKTELAALKANREKLAKSSVPVMIMDSLPDGKRRNTTMLTRGGYDKPGEEVNEGTPAFLPPLPEQARPDRLALARWLVDPSNPLTARVTVNRYWQTFFGRGIVASTEDFGSQGSRPTHPQLLDWLAVQFVESGWNVKALHKLIVMSATYRQSAVVSAQGKERDAENVWLSRAPRYRLPSWMLRDQALAMSGLLVEQIGGPSVRPYQPEGIWAEATFNKIRYQQDSGDKLYRRSLYTFWRRIVGPTMFFDSGKRQTCEVKPTRTNTPLHALTTMNETTFVEAARAFAQRAMSMKSKSAEERIGWAFRVATARQPKPQELQLLVRRFNVSKEHFSQDRKAATDLLSVGASARNEKLDLADHAAYTVVCSLLLNLDETLSRE